MVKDRDLHIRMTDDRFLAMAKKSLDLQITRSAFIEQAIDFYLDHLNNQDEKTT